MLWFYNAAKPPQDCHLLPPAASEHFFTSHKHVIMAEDEQNLKPGQKFPTPTPGNGDRVFYETLFRQRPDSEMAQDWWGSYNALFLIWRCLLFCYLVVLVSISVRGGFSKILCQWINPVGQGCVSFWDQPVQEDSAEVSTFATWQEKQKFLHLPLRKSAQRRGSLCEVPAAMTVINLNMIGCCRS